MEDKNPPKQEEKQPDAPQQPTRPAGGKVIQPTEDILKELSSQKEPEEPLADQLQSAPVAEPQPAPAASVEIPQIRAVPYQTAEVIKPSVEPAMPQETTLPNDAPAFSFADISIIQLIKIAGISALFFTALIWVQTRIVGGHITISGRLDIFFTFYPYLLTIGSLLVLAASGALSATLLKKQYYSLGWLRAVTVITPGIVFVGTLYVNWLGFALLILFSSKGTLPNWFNTYTYPLTFIVAAIMLAVSSVAALLILRITERRRYLGLICCALLALFFIGLVYLVRDVAAHNAENNIRRTSQSTQDNHNTATSSSSDANTEFSGLDFSVYVPSYLPAGYALQNNPDEQSIEKPTFYPSRGNVMPHFRFTYVGNDSAAIMAVDSFLASAQYQPPQDCAIDSFGEQAGACQLVGHSSIGCDVYYTDFNGAGPRQYFCKLKDDIINISEYGGQKAIDNTATPSQAEVMKVYNSLQIVSKQELTSKYAAITSSL